MIFLDPPADIFASGTRAIVIPTNCVGTNGAGLAKKAADRWPAWDEQYSRLCKSKTLKYAVEPGSMHLFDVQDGRTMRILIALPTKDHWRNPSRLEWIENGLRTLAEELDGSMLSVAVPALGCGYGDLDWNDVRPLMEEILSGVTGADIRIYAPHGKRRVETRSAP